MMKDDFAPRERKEETEIEKREKEARKKWENMH